MTVETSGPIRLRLLEEANGSFAADGSGTLGNYIGVPAIETTVKLALQTPLGAATPLQQYIDGYAEEHILPKTWTLDFSLPLATFDTRADDGVAAAQGALGRCFKIAFGDERLGTGDTVSDAGVAATDFDVATVARWAVGAALGVAAGGPSGGFGVREIEAIATDNLLFKQVFTAAPANLEDVYNCATYSLGLGGGSAVTSAQFLYEGIELDNRFILMGGQVSSIAFEIGPGVVPKVTFSWEGVQWFYADGSNNSADLTASALAAETYTNDLVNVVMDSVFTVGTVGTATSPDSIALHAPTINIALALSYVKHHTPGATQTVNSWIRNHVPPVVTGSFQIPHEDQTWFTARNDRTDHYVFYQIGSVAANGCVLLSVPKVQITDVQPVELSGISGQEVSWKGRHDTDWIGSGTSALRRSAFRVHMF